MRVKDILSKIAENKANGQMVTCLRKGKLKEAGISQDDFMNMKIDSKLKTLLFED
jgi:outer membrane usher protein FimD/PapC